MLSSFTVGLLPGLLAAVVKVMARCGHGKMWLWFNSMYAVMYICASVQTLHTCVDSHS